MKSFDEWREEGEAHHRMVEKQQEKEAPRRLRKWRQRMSRRLREYRRINGALAAMHNAELRADPEWRYKKGQKRAAMRRPHRTVDHAAKRRAKMERRKACAAGREMERLSRVPAYRPEKVERVPAPGILAQVFRVFAKLRRRAS